MLYHLRNCFAPGIVALCAAILLTVATYVPALELRYIPVLPPVVTNPSLGQMDLFGEGFGPPLFIVNISNAGDTNTYENLRIRYTVTIEFNDNGVLRRQRLYEGLTNEFSISPNEVLSLSSTRFLDSKNPDGKIGLRYMEYELDDMELKDQLVSSKLLPDGTLTFSLELFPSVDQIVDDNSYTHTLINTTSIDLVSPGNEMGQQVENHTNPRPVFIWMSQLYPGIYGTDDVFELRMYEARPGVSASDAVARPPFFTKRVNSVTFQYPSDAPPLVPGYSYYWEVIGFVKAAYTTEIKSEIFGFRLEPLADSTVLLNPRNIDDVLEMLRPVIGDAVVEEMREYVSGDIRIDNQSVSREELYTVLQKILSGHYTNDEPSVR